MSAITVELIDSMGGDRSVVNAARVSFARGCDVRAPLTDADSKLLAFLLRERHMSPFRHPHISFRIRAPRFVATQLYKHCVGIEGSTIAKDGAWNEESRRYVVDGEVWRPRVWRAQDPRVKQGSYGEAPGQEAWNELYDKAVATATEAYKAMIDGGVAREQARAVLPYGQMTTWIWTLSLEAALHVVDLRAAPDAQAETREVAVAIRDHLKDLFPAVCSAWEVATAGAPHSVMADAPKAPVDIPKTAPKAPAATQVTQDSRLAEGQRRLKLLLEQYQRGGVVNYTPHFYLSSRWYPYATYPS